MLLAASVTEVPDVPIEPAVEVRLTVPVPLTLSPPEKLPALVMLPADVKLMLLVPPTVPTAPCKPNEPAVAVKLIFVPVTFIAGAEFKLPALTRLKLLPAPELPAMLVVPAFASLI